MQQMVVADEPNGSHIVSQHAPYIYKRNYNRYIEPTIGEPDKWNKQSNALKYSFEPVALVRIQEVQRRRTAVVFGMEPPESVGMHEQVRQIEPDIIAYNGGQKIQHLLRLSLCADPLCVFASSFVSSSFAFEPLLPASLHRHGMEPGIQVSVSGYQDVS